MMQRLFLAFLVVACLATPASALNEWTVMLYWVSDEKESTALIKSHISSLKSLVAKAAAPGAHEVVVLFDGPPGYSAVDGKDADGGFRLEPQNGAWNIERLGELNMGSPYTLWTFLKWTAEKHPAKRYALFIGGHGSGIFSWRGPGGVNDLNPGQVDFSPDRFVGYDDSNNDCLTVFEVQKVLEAFKTKSNAGRKLDVLVLDSCLPGGLETLFQFREVIGLLVSSPSTTLIGGMPYPRIVSELAANVKVSAEDFSKAIAKAYLEKVITMSNDGEVMAVYATEKVQELAFALDQLSLQLISAQTETGKRASIKNLTTFGGKNRYWDLGRLLTSLSEGNADVGPAKNVAAIKTLAQEALDLIKTNRITTWYSGSYADNKIAGLSIAWPEKEEWQKWQKFYQTLDLSKATHWEDFLNTWHGLR